MNICFFCGGLSGGGAERVICSLCNYLSEKQHEVTVITMSSQPATYPLVNGVRRISLDEDCKHDNVFFKNIKRCFHLKTLLKKAHEDIFIVFLPATTFILLHYRKIIKAPIIASERCDPNTLYQSSKVYAWLMKRLFPRADAFVFQTVDAQKYYKGIITGESVVIPNAINNEFVREPFDGEREKRIIAAGRLTEQKNFPLLLKAFAKVSKKHSDYMLVIYGEGDQRSELEALVAQLEIAEQTSFPGYVDNFKDCIADASLFVLSSDYEGMPNALMEAMALGLPCISTDCPCGGPRYLIENGQNGFLVPINNVDVLAQAIDKVLSDPELANKLGKNAHQICEKLATNKIYAQWESYIMRIAQKNRM